MFSYPTPGDTAVAGYAMVADRFALVLGPEAGGDLATELWHALVAADSDFDDALSVIAAVGIGALPDFALVELVDAATSAVAIAVRGRASVELLGPQRSTYAGTGVGTWVEGSAQQVSGIALRLGPDAGGPALPLGRGVTRANSLAWGTAVPSLAGIDPLETVSVDRDDLLRAAGPRRRGASLPEAQPEEQTILGSRRPGAFVADAPAAPRHVLRIGGDELALDRPVVLGRSPRAADHPGARVAVVASPRKEVSASHLRAELSGDELVLRDLDSTNGTIVRRTDGSATMLGAGATIAVSVGTVLDLGDGVSVVFDTTS